jgi:CRISPR-associated endonuclease/helicase Cas3
LNVKITSNHKNFQVTTQADPQRDECMAHRYWGKADLQLGEHAFHPLMFHSLDVAAVVYETLALRPELLDWFAKALSLPRDTAHRLLSWIACVHDLGKFAENFQFYRPDLAEAAGLTRKDSTRRHDVVGFAIWEKALDEDAVWRLRLAQVANIRAPRWWLSLLHASTAHHGLPSCPDAYLQMRNEISHQSEQVALDFAEWAFRHFQLDASTPGRQVDRSALCVASWLLSGLVIYADWLGSNTEWFKYEHQSDLSLTDYWRQIALPRAKQAVAVSRSAPVAIAAMCPRTAAGLDQFPLRPAQQLALDLPLPVGPQCFVIEDATGSGKTEGALILALRLMQNGAANGLYFALPTMATANGLLPRLKSIAGKFFDHPEAAAMALAHGGAQWVEGFGKQSKFAPQEQDDGALTASLRASSWINDHSKRALIAQIGVGTIDQALLAVLKAKHNAVRLFGLFGKVLIIDEVHAYDAYQFKLIKALLTAHRAQGGSAILLSATLPQRQRAELLAVYSSESQDQVDADPAHAAAPYPLLSHASTAAIHPHALAHIPGLLKHYRVRYLSHRDDIVQFIVSSARRGQCVAWIRNTVADAMAAFKLVQAAIAAHANDAIPDKLDIQVRLFHARFTFFDRLRIENDVLACFGKAANASKRRGQIVIATQVIEQSLDLDFDELVTDLAPIDLMIQRAGRLQRHVRDAHSNVQAGDQADARGEPTLTVFGPDRSLAPEAVPKDWYARFSRGAALVYPHHGQIWHSAQALGDALNLVADARAPIEAVYASEKFPENLETGSLNAEGKALADAGIAGDNIVKVSEPFQRQGNWLDDERAPTRLGDPTVELALAVLRDGRIEPMDISGKTDAERWALSVVRVRLDWNVVRVKLDDAQLEKQASELEELPALKWRVLLVLEGLPLQAMSKKGCLQYSDLGLVRVSK